ncbi:MAG: hypothetical protein HY983_04075 [Candidatus Magasanikbacteria bacterium]|nr:hypothetical protein [Candidatus Magasanikbacteria bacterium]
MGNSDTKVTIHFWLLAVFFAVTLGGAGLGALYMTRANSIAKARIAENKETARPANIEAIAIKDKNCPECFDAMPLLANLENANVKLTSQRILDRTDDEAKTLIAKYAIAKLPTIILRGEVQKNADLKAALARAGDINGDTFVLRQVGGPYIAAATGKITGKTELMLIGDSSCNKCYDVKQHQAILSQFGLSPQITTVDVNSPSARALISRYQISLIPTFVLTGEVKEYPAFLKIWPQVGTVKSGAYIFTQGVPAMGVYRDLKTGKTIDPDQLAKQSGTTAKK